MSKSSRLRRWLPWVIAAIVLLAVLARVPFSELQTAFQKTSFFYVLLVVTGFYLCLLPADSLALTIAFRAGLGVKVRFSDVVAIRGASYLLTIVNYVAGQGAIAYFLNRIKKIPLARTAGAVVLATGIFLLTAMIVVAVAYWLGATTEIPNLQYLAGLVALGVPIYLLIIYWRPTWLYRFSFLTPFFDAHIRGTLLVALGRLLHLSVLIFFHFLGLRLFGIDISLPAAALALPLLFVFANLPISPAGLGTSQLAAVFLFASYAPGETTEAREAAVLAYSLSFHFCTLLVQGIAGLAWLRHVNKMMPTDTSE